MWPKEEKSLQSRTKKLKCGENLAKSMKEMLVRSGLYGFHTSPFLKVIKYFRDKQIQLHIQYTTICTH